MGSTDDLSGLVGGESILVSEIPDNERTTVMLRNLPNNYTREMLLSLIDSEGFAGLYNFVYLPMDFRNWAGFGYAFVNMNEHDDAQRLKDHFDGFCKWKVLSRKVCDAVWSGPHQGLAAHIERFRNSPVMHENVPDEYRPVLFANGKRIPFPACTKRIRPPRIRCSGSSANHRRGKATTADDGEAMCEY